MPKEMNEKTMGKAKQKNRHTQQIVIFFIKKITCS